MASVTTRKNGSRFITFIDGSGDPQTITLGKVALRYVESINVKVEDLASSKIMGHSPADETSRWLAALDDRLYAKLARVGLVKSRESLSLKTFIDSYIDGRVDVKPRTRFQLERVRDYLMEHFRPDVPLRSITPGDAEAWRLGMVKSGRATNTIRRAIGRSRQFLAAAIRRGLIERNPFEGMAAAVKGNPERFHFITQEDAEKIITACPDAQWRLILALCRWGGLRCPSEVLALTWDCIDWENDRVRVPSPKTAHCEGGASRIIPMFPELVAPLRDVFEEAEPGVPHVISRYRSGDVNLRTQLERIVRKAGLEPWGKPFQNLRSTRETELAQTFPLHVVCRWIGNSQPVAAKFYLQVTAEHFTQATQGAQRNAQRNLHETTGNHRKSEGAAERETPAQPLALSGLGTSFPVVSETCQSLVTPRLGLEPRT